MGMESRVCTTGMHIFEKGSTIATDSFFIYTKITKDEEHGNFLKRIQIENNLNERCGKLKFESYRIECSVLENNKMVMINPSAWTYAAKKNVDGVADLHSK